MDGDMFWTVIFVMLFWVPLILMWAFALIDLFHRDDLSGLRKVVWLLVIVLIPVFGVGLYFVRKPTAAWAEV